MREDRPHAEKAREIERVDIRQIGLCAGLTPFGKSRKRAEFAATASIGLLDDPRICGPSEALPPLKPERLLCRWSWLQVNTLQREHADLGRRAAWRGKTANLTSPPPGPCGRG